MLGPAKGMRWPMKRVGVWDSTHFLIPLWSIDYSMSTTVEVKRATAKLLEEIKQKYQARSYDETIRKLIDKAESVPDSMFGAHPKMKSFTRRDEALVHEL